MVDPGASPLLSVLDHSRDLCYLRQGFCGEWEDWCELPCAEGQVCCEMLKYGLPISQEEVSDGLEASLT